MQYRYSDTYGSHVVEQRTDTVTRKRYTYQQDKVDSAVDKALVQCMKEDKLPFSKLLAVLQRELVQAMHAADRSQRSASESLHMYKGHKDNHDYTLLHSDLAGYWRRQLLDADGKVV